MPYLLKLALTVVMVLAITETTKRFGFWGSLLAALPVVSLISMVWIYLDTKDVKISDFSIQVFWFVLPSLGLFVALPVAFDPVLVFASLGLGSLITLILYLLMLECSVCDSARSICGSDANQRRSKRSRFITLVQAATKSWRNFSPASALP